MRDAELCARAIDESLRNPNREAAAHEQYELQRNDLSEPLYREARSLARYRWTPEEASLRMRRISDAVREECNTLAALAFLPMPVSPATAQKPGLALSTPSVSLPGS